MYPDERVVRFIEDNLVPVRIHVRDQKEEYQRLAKQYGAQWTPTILFLDPEGGEHHRIEGFLPADDFMAQIALGLGHIAMAREDHSEASHRFQAVLNRHPESEMAAEALYWDGVARYKETGDAGVLKQTAASFQSRFRESTWAKKASVWLG